MPRSLLSSARAALLFLAQVGVTSATLASVSGCVQPCNPDRTCAVDDEKQVCDGTHWSPCDDTNRNARISCTNSQKSAVCTPSGWTFQSN